MSAWVVSASPMECNKSSISQPCQSIDMMHWSRSVPEQYKRLCLFPKSWWLLRPHRRISYQLEICEWLPWILQPRLMHNEITNKQALSVTNNNHDQQMLRAQRFANQFETTITQVLENMRKQSQKKNMYQT